MFYQTNLFSDNFMRKESVESRKIKCYINNCFVVLFQKKNSTTFCFVFGFCCFVFFLYLCQMYSHYQESTKNLIHNIACKNIAKVTDNINEIDEQLKIRILSDKNISVENIIKQLKTSEFTLNCKNNKFITSNYELVLTGYNNIWTTTTISVSNRFSASWART